MFCFYITIHLAVNNKVHVALIGSIRFIHRKISKHITKHDRFKRHQNRAVLVNLISGSDGLFTIFYELVKFTFEML